MVPTMVTTAGATVGAVGSDEATESTEIEVEVVTAPTADVAPPEASPPRSRNGTAAATTITNSTAGDGLFTTARSRREVTERTRLQDRDAEGSRANDPAPFRTNCLRNYARTRSKACPGLVLPRFDRTNSTGPAAG